MTTKRPKVLVMGGLGFIGAHVCRALRRLGYPLSLFDNGAEHRAWELPREAEIHSGNVDNPADVLRALRDVEVVIDLIHTTVPGSSMQDPARDVRSNVEAAANWLSQLKHTNLTRIIYVSSGGTVYGVPKSNPITEDHPTDPISSYGITKLAIEKYVAMYANLYGIEYRIARPSNAYGEGQRLDAGQGAIGIFLRRTLEGAPIEIWGNGSSQRDYVHVEDLADGIVRLIEHQGESRTFHLSSGVGHSLNDILAVLREELRRTPMVQYGPSRGFDVPANVLDHTRARIQLNWEPRVDLRQGIHRVHRWLLGRQAAPSEVGRPEPAAPADQATAWP